MRLSKYHRAPFLIENKSESPISHLWDTKGNFYEIIDSIREEGSEHGKDILYLFIKHPHAYQIGWVAGNEGIGGRFILAKPTLLWFCSKPGQFDVIQQVWGRVRRRINSDMDMAPPMECGVVWISETPPETEPLAEATKQDFVALADAQRGNPEAAMIAAQEILGGGVMSFVIEHVGDLIHRMNEEPTWRYAGYDYVLEKVNKTLRMLKSGYGFIKEFNENLASTAQYRGVDLEELKTETLEALRNYAEEHRKLPVYNKAHQFARAAAIALGELRINDAIGFLDALLLHLGSEEEWVAFAREGCDLREDEERVKFQPGWGSVGIECLCGNTFDKDGFVKVEPVFGIGNRATGDYDESNEGKYFLCLSCGRVTASSKATEPEGVVVRSPNAMTEGITYEDDEPPYEDVTDMVPSIFRDTDVEWVGTYKTVEAVRVNGFDDHVIVLFSRPDLSNEDGGYFNIGVFSNQKGIGGRDIPSWGECVLSKGIKAESAMDRWLDIKCGDIRYIDEIINFHSYYSRKMVFEDTFSNNEMPSGFDLIKGDFKWKIIDSFEVEGQQHSFLVCLTSMAFPPYRYFDGNQIAYIEIIQGIGNRTQIDWQNVRLGPSGGSHDMGERYEQIKKFSIDPEWRMSLVDAILAAPTHEVSHLYFDR